MWSMWAANGLPNGPLRKTRSPRGRLAPQMDRRRRFSREAGRSAGYPAPSTHYLSIAPTKELNRPIRPPKGGYPRFISDGFISNGFISFGQSFKAS